ncbi:hypothetical protein [Acidovorax delafieldii]|uniref:hypothetical protein n=1 Tax=Acidovorax delafieldii TaxID=47920 RepID=UPI003ECE1C69
MSIFRTCSVLFLAYAFTSGSVVAQDATGPSGKKSHPTSYAFAIDKGTEREHLGLITVNAWKSIAGKRTAEAQIDGDLIIALFQKGSAPPKALVPVASLLSVEWSSLRDFAPSVFVTRESRFDAIESSQLWLCNKGINPSPQTCFQPSTGTLTVQPKNGSAKVRSIQYFTDLWAIATTCTTTHCPKRELVQTVLPMPESEFHGLFAARNAEYADKANSVKARDQSIAKAEMESERKSAVDRIKGLPAGTSMECESTALLLPGHKLSDLTFQCAKLGKNNIVPLKVLIASGWVITDEIRTPSSNQVGEKADNIRIQLQKS